MTDLEYEEEEMRDLDPVKEVFIMINSKLVANLRLIKAFLKSAHSLINLQPVFVICNNFNS